jgi:ABC-2 type transport system permease protein
MFYLQLRNELWKLFAKKRTYIGFGMFLVVQLLIVLLFRYNSGARAMVARPILQMGLTVESLLSNLTIAVAVLVPVAYIMMPLYLALVGGDLVAKEVEDGTLRMILSRPVSRFRLLWVKWVAGAIFSIILAFALGATSVGIASIFFPPGGLFTAMPWERVFCVFDQGEGWQRFLLANLVLTIKAITVMGLAFMFSCFNMKPAAATIVALSVFMISKILQDIPYFANLQEWFLTYHLNVWAGVFRQPVPWLKMGESLSLLLGFNISFFIIGWVAFQMRDFKS